MRGLIVDFHGIKCRYSMYRVMGENKPVLTPVGEVSDWKKLVEYDFEEPTNGLWCHFLTDEEIDTLFAE